MGWLGSNDFESPAVLATRASGDLGRGSDRIERQNTPGMMAGLPGPAPAFGAATDDTLVPAGALVLDFIRPTDGEDTVLLALRPTVPWPREIRFAIEQACVVYHHIQGGQHLSGRIPLSGLPAGAALRLTLNWDAVARRGSIALESPNNPGVLRLNMISAPMPHLLGDLWAMLRARRGAVPAGLSSKGHPGKPMVIVGPEVSALMASTSPQAVGPMPALAGDSWIETEDGLRRLASLRPGQRVPLQNGTSAPIRHVIARDVVCFGHFSPVILRAPFLDLAVDTLVAPGHRLMIKGPEAEYLFGQEAVLAQAQDLARAFGARQVQDGRVRRLFGLVFDRHCVVRVNGAWMESQYLGALYGDHVSGSGLDQRLWSASCLAHLPRMAHDLPCAPLISRFETQTLMEARLR